MFDCVTLSTRPAAIRAAVATGGLVTALALTGCGTGYGGDGTSPAASRAAAAAAAASPVPPAAPVETSAPGGAAAGKTPTLLQAKRTKKMGVVVTDEKGWLLYRFDGDTANPSKSSCNGNCATVWPPVMADNQQIMGLDATKVGTVTRADGSIQVTLSGWPLYYYLGDRKPGDWTGQNVARKWFAVAPTGKKNLTCVPANPPPPPVVPDTNPIAPTEDAPQPPADGGSYSY